MATSSLDMLALVGELNTRRIAKIGGILTARNGGIQPQLPRQLTKDLKTCRRLHYRYAVGNYTHSDQEEAAVLRAADWCVQLWAELHNQPQRQWDMSPAKLRTSEPPPPQSYIRAIEAAHKAG